MSHFLSHVSWVKLRGFPIAETFQCKLVREYRGHSAAVVSVGTSADNKFVVSASDDGTVGFWKLDEAFSKNDAKQEWMNRWGGEFEIKDNQLLAKQILEDGPLFFRGVRSGDIIEKISWRFLYLQD